MTHSSDKGWKSWDMDRIAVPSPTASEGSRIVHEPGAGTLAKNALFKKQEFEDLKKKEFEKAYQAGFSKGETQGIEDGYQHGLEQGLIEAENRISKQIEDKAASILAMTTAFQQQISVLDEAVISQITSLSLRVAKQLAARTIALNSHGLNKEIEALLHEYPDLIGTPVLWISEEDANKLGQVAEDIKTAGWRLNIDSTMSPGGCKLTSKQTEVDLSMETRLIQLAERLIESETT